MISPRNGCKDEKRERSNSFPFQRVGRENLRCAIQKSSLQTPQGKKEKKKMGWKGNGMSARSREKEKAKSQPMGLEIGAKTEGRRRKWNFLPPKMEEKASQGAKTAKNPFKVV